MPKDAMPESRDDTAYAALPPSPTPRADPAPTRNPLDTAGWLSQLTMWWINPALRNGYKQAIVEDEVWQLPSSDVSAVLQEKFDRFYAQEKKKNRSDATPAVPIHNPMWQATREKMGLAIFLHLVSAAATLVQPLLIKSLLQVLQGSDGYNGVFLAIMLLVAFALGQGGLLAADYFVKFWSDGSMSNSFGQTTLLWTFVGIVGLATVLSIIRAVVFTEICIQASKALHARYFLKVLMAPIPTFFDVTPVGRILNRFSRDLDQIDNPLPYYALGLLMFFMLALSIFVVCAVTTPITLVLYPPLLYACYYVQKFFLASSRELKRLDGVTRSPFLNLVAETINGIESIRAFRMSEHFSSRCRELLDYNSKFYFMFQSSSKWFSMRLDWLTIADSDRILVMEHGEVAEFDSPANLLTKTDGIFASLMASTK
ncbi:hypothetical protein P43SY_004059 [Pythium insidiosum]|uniref:ABC transmembrane type-1 domain-containing protein n=1 Tax=Pythium insidiosum TaxID=114742 RepID=A0AAD5Q923_PYTIN|nr:hypothetical protein P43SY_004059 [Pythium insidiosum]